MGYCTRNMPRLTWFKCEELYARRRKGSDWRRITRNTRIERDVKDGVTYFKFRHYNTVTVEIWLDKYVIFTRGWNTITAKQYIGNVTGIHLGTHKPVPSAEDALYVYLGNDRDIKFMDGMEFSTATLQPLNPDAPEYQYTVRRTDRKITKNFSDMRARLKARILPRLMVGEFDEGKGAEDLILGNRNAGRVLDGYTLLERVESMLEAYAEDEFIPHAELAEILRRRPVHSFGRFGRRPRQSPTTPYNGLQLFDSAMNAARVAFCDKYHAYKWVYPKKDEHA